ncbi:MAG: EAL domain-containing protein [Pseudomonadales bacterium]
MIDLLGRRINFLLVEDDEDDYVILSELCEEAFGSQCYLKWISSYDAAVIEIERNEYDLFLIDNRLGAHLGLELINCVINHYHCPPPVILLTGVDSHETDISAMRAGAADYLIKQGLTAQELERSVRYAIQHKKDQDRLTRLAHYDSLTGLANRSLFHNKLEGSINHAGRTGKLVALFLLDLDRFKDINDTLGHPAGDELLLKVSARIRQSMRETDTVARLGGDEFAVVATHLDNISDVGKLAKNLMATFSKTFILHNQPVPVRISMGVAIYPHDSGNVDELFKQGDLALYDAKEHGRDTFSFFNKGLDLAIRKRQYLQAEMATGIINGDFVLHYQPIVNVNNREVVSAEVLIRWKHPDKGLIPPDEFIPIAESSGFIVPLGDWVICEVCRQKQQWHKEGIADFPLAINLAASQFYSDKLLQLLNHCITECRLKPSDIVLEITENTLMKNTDDVSLRIKKLHEKGFSFSLDDFGTGYSSLAYLKRFPVDKIKIDRSMVDGIPDNTENSVICQAVISIGQAFGLKVIAEGVETHSQLQYLQSIGCHQAQGYFISRPLSSKDFSSWLQRKRFVALPGSTHVLEASTKFA